METINIIPVKLGEFVLEQLNRISETQTAKIMKLIAVRDILNDFLHGRRCCEVTLEELAFEVDNITALLIINKAMEFK